MPQVKVTNSLSQEISIYDSFSNGSSGNSQNSDTSYYGNLTLMGTVPANGQTTLTLKHPYADALIAFDPNNAPLARYQWNMLDSNTPPPFTVSQTDVTAIQQSEQFVIYIVQNPNSDIAKNFHTAANQGPEQANAFFKATPQYSQCTFSTYMLASTYEAQTPATKSQPPAQKVYSLSHLIESISGLPYPSELPDIEISNFYCEYTNNVLNFGGRVTLSNLPFENEAVGANILSLFPIKEVDVEVIFNTQVGLNIFGTQILFVANNFNIPVGGGKTITINTPSVSIDITPAFKFVVFTVRAIVPFSIFGSKFNANISMTIDNIEAEIGAVIDGDHSSLPSPPILKGVHFDEFGIGMGIIFEPEGYAIGVQGKFHIGSGSSIVSLDDDTFVIVCELEGDVPNPVYLSFYVPRFDLSTLINLFTNANVNIDFPIEFEDLSFTWCENPMEPVVLPDGSLSNGEYAFSAYMNILGLRFYCNLQISLNGIQGVAVLAPINLGGILKIGGNSKPITVKEDAAGNIIKNNQIPTTQAEKQAIATARTVTLIPGSGAKLQVNTSSSPYFSLMAVISLLGIHNEIEAQIDKSGISFELDYGSLIQTKMSCVIKDFQNFTGNFRYGPDFDVHLPTLFGFSLGTIHIDDTISAMLGLAISASKITFTAGGGFDFEGLSCNFGPFSLDINISSITDVLSSIEQYIIREAGKIFEAIVNDAKKWAGWVKNEIIKGVGDVVQGLRDGFKLAYQEAADILHDVGYDARFISQGLKDIYNVGSDVIAGILKGYGYATDAITDALKYVGYGVSDVVGALKSVGYDAEDVARSIDNIFTGVVPSVLNSAMQDAGYAVDDIKNAFESIGGALGNFAEETWHKITHVLNPSNW